MDSFKVADVAPYDYYRDLEAFLDRWRFADSCANVKIFSVNNVQWIKLPLIVDKNTFDVHPAFVIDGRYLDELSISQPVSLIPSRSFELPYNKNPLKQRFERKYSQYSWKDAQAEMIALYIQKEKDLESFVLLKCALEKPPWNYVVNEWVQSRYVESDDIDQF